MILLFDHERDGDGRPVLKVPGAARVSDKQAFRRRCYLNAVTDPAVVEQLWTEERARRAEKSKGTKKGKKKARRRNPRGE